MGILFCFFRQELYSKHPRKVLYKFFCTAGAGEETQKSFHRVYVMRVARSFFSADVELGVIFA